MSTPPSLRLCFVGPMVGRNPGQVTTQGQILSDLFKGEGYPLISVSDHPNRYMRLLDIVGTLIRQRNRIDIIVLDVYGGRSFVVEDIASRLGRLFGHKIIMVLRGGAMPDFMARFPGWTTSVLSRADRLLAPSDYLARAVVPYGFQAQVIPNVIDLANYPYRHRTQLQPRMLWMRTFHPFWNPEMAVRVLARLREVRPETSLVMAGQDKGLRSDVQQLAQELGVADAVRFPGFLDMEDKAREGDAADIFINTNHVDNMPVAVVEACAMGLPVVATEVGGIPDLLTNEENALLVPDSDEEAMAQAILRLLNDPDLAGRLSTNGRKLAERSSWEQVRQQWDQLFDEVISYQLSAVSSKLSF